MGWRALALLVVCVWSYASQAAPPSPIAHDLHVRLDPAGQHLHVQDSVTLPADLLRQHPQALTVVLHQHLALQLRSDAYVLEPLSTPLPQAAVPLQAYRVRPRSGQWPVPATLEWQYQGIIHHALTSADDTGSGMASPGMIDPQGTVLSGSTWWLPTFATPWVTFAMTVDVPADWQVLSQGQRTLEAVQEGRRHVHWESQEPMTEVYVLAGPWSVYAREAEAVRTYAFLRQPDAALAARYLDVTTPYIAMYSQLLGPYPYPKFAVVENFWETGYGMPSFTLLGSTVLRLPFILHSSYPHEILHNWWGNGVYVNAAGGNWSEGLTAYLADHLLKEAQGLGAEYRRETLQSYRSYVQQGRDFPLVAFQARHSAATQAVGYGKALMMWHMLRQELGDAMFVAGLRQFYQTYRFQAASFDELAQSFLRVSGRDLQTFFQQWTQRIGAPSLTLQVALGPGDRGHVMVSQEGSEEPYEITVPVVLTYARETRLQSLPLHGRAGRLMVADAAQLQRVDVDPAFDLFRRLHHTEVPPSLAQLFGAERALFILPEAADAGEINAWREAVAAWARRYTAVEIRHDREPMDFPADRAVWLFGSQNRWQQGLVAPLAAYGVSLNEMQVSVGTTEVERQTHSVVMALQHPANPDLAIAWVSAASVEALPGLLRKLPHYGKYSYVAFRGVESTNTLKGQWPVLHAPLTWNAPASHMVPMGELPPRHPLARP